MTDEEFAERRAQIQAECRRGIELIEAACREQLQALELLHRSGRPIPMQGTAVAAAGMAPVSPPAPGPSPAVPPAPAATTPAPAPPAPARRTAGETCWDIQQALPRLPEVFTTPELVRVIGYAPHRGTLHRLLAELEAEGALRREWRGEGKQLSRYRRLSPAPREATGGGGEAPAAAQEERGTPAPGPGAAAAPGAVTPDGAG